MRYFTFLLLAIVLVLSSCSIEKTYQANVKRAKQSYEQINFVELMKKYMDKNTGNESIEGIYSVSGVVLKKSKGFFASEAKERTVFQKDHYAQVAVIRDNARNNREFIEIPIDKNYLASYSIRGEFTALSEGNVLVLKHFEPKGHELIYSFIYDRERDMLEGIRVETSGSVTYTYKLTFVKLYPKQTMAQK
jgi:hypothetical protein